MKYILIVLLFTFSLALAQTFSGTFQNDQGTGQITLQQAPDGSVQGSFTGANGQMQLQGYVGPQGAYGNLIGQDAQLVFQAQLSPDGSTLQLMVAPLGQNGQPDLSAAQQLTYRRVGVAQLNVPSPVPTPTNQPLPTPTQPVPTQPMSDPYIGSFSDGYFSLQLQGANGQYQGVFVVDGQQIPVSARGDASVLTGTLTEQDVEYVFTLSLGANGIVFAIDGEQFPLQRQAGQATGPMSVNPMPTPVPQPTPVSPTPVNLVPTPQPTPVNPLSVNPMPVSPVPTPPVNPQPVPSAPSSPDGMPQPPTTPWQGNYQIAVYSQANPSQKQTGVLTLQVTPTQDGNFHVVSALNGQTLVDITVTAVGINTATGQEEFPLVWNTGKSSVYGVSGQLTTQNGMTLFAVQSGQDGAQAMYDTKGLLVSYQGCISGECTEMNLGQ
jgi:hypothetical protein